MVNRQLVKDVFGWGIVLWLMGYVLGIVLFMVAPLWLVGWIIMPIGTAITVWILDKKISSTSFVNYVLLAIGWVLITMIFDYFLLVKVFKPTDGYYKLDVYLYYLLTFTLPLIIGWRKSVAQK